MNTTNKLAVGRGNSRGKRNRPLGEVVELKVQTDHLQVEHRRFCSHQELAPP